MKSINVEGLPEPVAQALAAMVQTIRSQLGRTEEPRKRTKLLTKRTRVIGPLTRKDIYENVQ